MKSRASALLLLLISLAPSIARGQEPLDIRINDLQKQISLRAKIDRDQSTPADLKTMNRRVLQDKRIELREGVQTRIVQLQKYLSTLGTSASAEERQYAQTSLRNLVSIRDGLVGSTDVVNVVGGSTSTVTVRSRAVGSQRLLNNRDRESGETVPKGPGSASVVLDAVSEGDSVIRGSSVASVNEVLVE